MVKVLGCGPGKGALSAYAYITHTQTVHSLQSVVYFWKCTYVYVLAVEDAAPSVFMGWLREFPTLSAGKGKIY